MGLLKHDVRLIIVTRGFYQETAMVSQGAGYDSSVRIKTWHKHLSPFASAIRLAVNRHTGYKLMLGRDVNNSATLNLKPPLVDGLQN